MVTIETVYIYIYIIYVYIHEHEAIQKPIFENNIGRPKKYIHAHVKYT